MKTVLIIGTILVLAIDAAILYYWPKQEPGPMVEDWVGLMVANVMWAGLAYFKGVKGK